MGSVNSLSITDALVEYLRESGLEQSVLDVQIEDLWPKVMGETVAKLTRSIEVNNGMLVVHVNSAALKAQLFENQAPQVSEQVLLYILLYTRFLHKECQA